MATKQASLPQTFFVVTHSSAGGAQNIWVNLASGMAEQGQAVEVLALYPAAQPQIAVPSNVRLSHILSHRPRGVTDWGTIFARLVAKLRQNNHTFAFTAQPAANALVPLAALVGGAKARVFLSHHTPINSYSKLFQFADKWIGLLPTVRSIVCVSNAVRDPLEARRSHRYMAKTITIKNALPRELEEKIAQYRSARPSMPASQRLIIATGRLAPQKNYRALLHAMTYLQDVKLQIVGDGAEREDLQRLSAELSLSSRVFFLGHQSREATIELVSKSSAFVQPSFFEGHSLAVIEAAKLGLPVVVSDVPSQIEAVTSKSGEVCGVVAAVNDPADLAGKIRFLLDEPGLYKKMAEMATILGNEISFDLTLSEYQKLSQSN